MGSMFSNGLGLTPAQARAEIDIGIAVPRVPRVEEGVDIFAADTASLIKIGYFSFLCFVLSAVSAFTLVHFFRSA